MFKELIATCLLVGACNSPSTKINEPRNAYLGSTYVCSGAYSFNETFDYDSFFKNVEGNYISSYNDFDYYEVNLHIAHSSSKDLTLFTIQQDTIDFGYTLDLDYINIFCEYTLQNDELFDATFTITGFKVGDLNIFESLFQYTDVGDVFDLIDYTQYFNPYTDVIENFVLCFNTEYYLVGDYALLFNLFFGKGGNSYVTWYDGFYHYNNGSWYDNGAEKFEYSFGALFSFQSYMFNSYYYYTNQVMFNNIKYDGTMQSRVTTYDYGTYVDVSNVTVTGLLPQYVRTSMAYVGQFGFVNDTVPSSWYDMMLSTMDAPIYYLKNLLGFELFGTELFLAFASLMTLVLVIAVIKKVV